MKFIVVLFGALIVMLSSCHHRHHNTSFSISENGKVYQLKASFNPSKTANVNAYIDERLSSNSFANTETDGIITMDDETRLYVKSRPGFVKIRFNKKENSEEALIKVRNICEDLKLVINE